MIENNIKKYRKERGMSQEELARELNVVRQTISKWENGLSLPDAQSAAKLAELLNVSIDDLLGTLSNIKESKVSAYPEEQQSTAAINEMMYQFRSFQKVYIKRDRKIKKVLKIIMLLLIIFGAWLALRCTVVLVVIMLNLA